MTFEFKPERIPKIFDHLILLDSMIVIPPNVAERMASNRPSARMVVASPDLETVSISERKLGRVAVFKFGGWATENRTKNYIDQLINSLKKSYMINDLELKLPISHNFN